MQNLEYEKLSWEAPILISNIIDETEAGVYTFGNHAEAVHNGMTTTYGFNS